MMNKVERNAEEAFKLHQKISENEAKRRELFFENVSMIDAIFKNDFHKSILGDEKASIPAYLSQLEVFYSRSDLVRWLRVKHFLMDEKGYAVSELSEIPVVRLENIVSLVKKNPEELEELLEKSKHLTNKDWKNEMNRLKGKPQSDDGHQHDYQTYLKCSICGTTCKKNHE